MVAPEKPRARNTHKVHKLMNKTKRPKHEHIQLIN
jgi:hypothetical protein